jgi:hypothetical protein
VTTFNSPLNIEVAYQEEDVAAIGSSEDDLVLITYDERLESWVPLPSTVDTTNNRVNAHVGHFSHFALAASTEIYKIFVPIILK